MRKLHVVKSSREMVGGHFWVFGRPLTMRQWRILVLGKAK